MSDKPQSVLMTYVTHRDALDREHDSLCSTLRVIVRDCETSTLFAQNLSLLSKVFELMQQHHQTEDQILAVVDSTHAKVHIELHKELLNLLQGILERTQAELKIDQIRVKKLLDVLEHHVLTLDQELIDAVSN